MSVHKDSKRGTWYVKYKNKTKRGFAKKADAVKYENELMIGKEEMPTPKIENVSLTFGEAAEMYLQSCKSSTQYGTFKKNEIMLKTFVFPTVKDVPIGSIEKVDCLRFRETINSLDRSTAYKNNILSAYKAVFRYAFKCDLLQSDPSAVISKIKKSYKEKVKAMEDGMNIWTIEDFSKFIAKEKDPRYRALFVSLYFSGLRLGEAVSLKWEDYDGESFSINKSLTRKTAKGSYEIKEPKSPSSVRKVPLSDSVNRYLAQYKKERMKDPSFSDSWFMFGDYRPLAENSITRHKDRAIKAANVRRIRIHDFRHSHASNLISQGVNIVAVSKRLGHKDVSITLSVYTHLLEKNNEELLIRIEENSKGLLTNLLTAENGL